MSLNVSNMHVRTDDRRAVQRLITAPALISPSLSGWTSIYLRDELQSSISADALAQGLRVPAVAFTCFESSVALAELSTEGASVTQLTSAHPDLLEEVFGLHPAEPIVAQNQYFTVWIDVDRWSEVLGEVSPDELREAATPKPDDPFVESAAFDVLALFGIAPDRLDTKYEWIESSDSDEDFLQT